MKSNFKTDSLNDRMKRYESVSRTELMRRTPAILRLDGRAFSTFTENFEKPFDPVFAEAMQETMRYLCKNIQGCVLGYTQSDEITLVLCDYQNLNTAAWFDYNVQKCVSVAAGMASAAFARYFEDAVKHTYDSDDPEISKYYEDDGFHLKFASFDARIFSLTIEEVTNNILWRQEDGSRNSINALGRAYFSHAELKNKHCGEVQDMVFKKTGINWNNLPTTQKRGCCCIKVTNTEQKPDGILVEHNVWTIDHNIPTFSGDGREYIERRIHF